MFLFFLFSTNTTSANKNIVSNNANITTQGNNTTPIFLKYKNAYVSARTTKTAYIVIVQPIDKKTPAYVGFYPLSSVDKFLSTTPKFFSSYSLPGIEHVRKVTQKSKSINDREIAWVPKAELAVESLTNVSNVASGNSTVGEGIKEFLVGAGAVVATEGALVLLGLSNPVGWGLLASAAAGYVIYQGSKYVAGKAADYTEIDKKIDKVLGTERTTNPNFQESPTSTEKSTTTTENIPHPQETTTEESPIDKNLVIESLNSQKSTRASYKVGDCSFDKITIESTSNLLVERFCKKGQGVEECMQ